MNESRSQFGQEDWVLSLDVMPRVFVDVGASDGVTHSNTLMLERAMSWTGLCIEPGRSFEHLRRNRGCWCDPALLWSERRELAFVESRWSEEHGFDELGQLSGVESELRRFKPTGDVSRRWSETLTDVFRRWRMPWRIGYLSLDAEGSELFVLLGLDPRYVFRAATVEHNGDTAKRDAVRELMCRMGYELSRELDIEDWFTHDLR